MTIQVRYYARLKEEAGLAQEALETSATTVGQLWTEVSSQHHFTLEQRLIKVAQADEFCEWDSPLKAGALVVFMPPVAGG